MRCMWCGANRGLVVGAERANAPSLQTLSSEAQLRRPPVQAVVVLVDILPQRVATVVWVAVTPPLAIGTQRAPIARACYAHRGCVNRADLWQRPAEIPGKKPRREGNCCRYRVHLGTVAAVPDRRDLGFVGIVDWAKSLQREHPAMIKAPCTCAVPFRVAFGNRTGLRASATKTPHRATASASTDQSRYRAARQQVASSCGQPGNNSREKCHQCGMPSTPLGGRSTTPGIM